MTTTDAEHRARVIRALQASREIDALDIGVRVRGGTVTLTGEVGSAAERLAARSIVFGDRATTSIVDELRVTPLPGEWRLRDDEITTLVGERLATHPGLAGVVAACDFHIVRLDGTVSAAARRRTAHHVARTTPGVHFVIDRIEVGHAASDGPAKRRAASGAVTDATVSAMRAPATT